MARRIRVAHRFRPILPVVTLRVLSIPKTQFSWNHGRLWSRIRSCGVARRGAGMGKKVSADAVEQRRRREYCARHESCPRRIGRRHGFRAPLTRLAAPRGPRAAASARRPSGGRAASTTEASRPPALGVAFARMVWLAYSRAALSPPRLGEAEDGHLLAAQALSRSLDAAEPKGSAGPASHRQGGPRSHPEDLGVQSLLGITTHLERAAEAGHRRGQVHGGEVQGPSTQAAVADMAGLPRQPRQGAGVAGRCSSSWSSSLTTGARSCTSTSPITRRPAGRLSRS